MICLAAEASHDAQLVFFTPAQGNQFRIVSGMVDIEPIWRALGKEKERALPIFNAFTGADNIGKFSGIGKTKWFQQYMKADIDLPRALMKLPVEGDPTQEVKDRFFAPIDILAVYSIK